MKLTVNPMPKLIAEAANSINSQYSMRMGSLLPIRMAHEVKATQAKQVLEGSKASKSFVAEANLRKMSIEAFAKLVLDKANSNVHTDLELLELERQNLLVAVEKAETPAEIQKILEEGNVHK